MNNTKQSKTIAGALAIAELVRSFSIENPVINDPYVELDEDAIVDKNNCRPEKGYVLKIKALLRYPISIYAKEEGELKCFKNYQGNWVATRMREVLAELNAKRVGYDEEYEYYTVTLPKKK